MNVLNKIFSISLASVLFACNNYTSFDYFDREAQVTDIHIEVSSLTLDPGGVQAITYWPIPANADLTKLKWASSNPEVAIVSEWGIITAVSGGSANVTVSADGISKAIAVTVNFLDYAPDVVGKYMGSGTLNSSALGVSNLPVAGQVVELTYSSKGLVALTTDVVVTGLGVIKVTGSLSVSKNGSDYALTGTGATSDFGQGSLPATITGKVDANGSITLKFDISGAATLDYTGLNFSDPAPLTAGDYKGPGTLVSPALGGTIPYEELTVSVAFASAGKVTVKTAAAVPGLGAITVDCTATVTLDGDFKIEGEGKTNNFGMGEMPAVVTGLIDNAGNANFLFDIAGGIATLNFSGKR